MKKLLFTALAGSICFAFNPASAQQTFKTRIIKQFTMSKGTVAVYTINGTVKVEGYSGGEVLFEAEEVITAKNEKDLNRGKKEVGLTFEQKSDTILAYTVSPRDSRPNIYNNPDTSDLPYSYSINYTVKVPAWLNLDIITINGESLSVSDVSGTLNLRNIRGSISIVNARGNTDARTMSGDLTATFVAAPQKVFFKTMSGEIKTRYPEDLSADLRLHTVRGEFYTDFPKHEILPRGLDKSVDHKGGKIYKTDVGVRIGNGGKEFWLETVNGDIYVQKLL